MVNHDKPFLYLALCLTVIIHLLAISPLSRWIDKNITPKFTERSLEIDLSALRDRPEKRSTPPAPQVETPEKTEIAEKPEEKAPEQPAEPAEPLPMEKPDVKEKLIVPPDKKKALDPSLKEDRILEEEDEKPVRELPPPAPETAAKTEKTRAESRPLPVSPETEIQKEQVEQKTIRSKELEKEQVEQKRTGSEEIEREQVEQKTIRSKELEEEKIVKEEIEKEKIKKEAIKDKDADREKTEEIAEVTEPEQEKEMEKTERSPVFLKNPEKEVEAEESVEQAQEDEAASYPEEIKKTFRNDAPETTDDEKLEYSLNSYRWTFERYVENWAYDLQKWWKAPLDYSFGQVPEGGNVWIKVQLSQSGRLLAYTVLESDVTPEMELMVIQALVGSLERPALPDDFPEERLVIFWRFVYPPMRPEIELRR